MEMAIALILGLAIGAGAIHFWLNPKIARKDKQIEHSKQQLDRVEQDYESRMQQTIAALRKDYEEQSREKIETFKKQYHSKIQELQQSHQAQIESLQQSDRNASSLKQQHDREIKEYERQIKAYAEQIQEYERQIQQLTELPFDLTLSEGEESELERVDRTYLSAQEQLSEEAMEELMKLLDDAPPRK